MRLVVKVVSRMRRTPRAGASKVRSSRRESVQAEQAGLSQALRDRLPTEVARRVHTDTEAKLLARRSASRGRGRGW